jgi:hypothetical protein
MALQKIQLIFHQGQQGRDHQRHAGQQHGRLRALEALGKIKDISTKVVTHTDDDIPAELVGKDMARRYYGQVRERIALLSRRPCGYGTTAG